MAIETLLLLVLTSAKPAGVLTCKTRVAGPIAGTLIVTLWTSSEPAVIGPVW
jgi:hypothetical protein